MECYTVTEYSHLEHLALGVKRMKRSESRERNFHTHHYSELAFILHAEGTIHHAEGKSAELKRGDVLLLHPGVVHGYENTGTLELVNLLYEAEKLPLPLLDGAAMGLFRFLASAKEPDQPSPELPLVHLEEEPFCQLLSPLDDLETELSGELPGKHLRTFALFIDILTLLARAGGESGIALHPDSVEEALAYLNRHFREKLSVPKLARMVYMSERKFFRAFRELTGCAPQEYRHRKQLEYAAELLKTVNWSLTRIAAECGFCDSNYLIKRFKAAYGSSPGSFRRQRHFQH